MHTGTEIQNKNLSECERVSISHTRQCDSPYRHELTRFDSHLTILNQASPHTP